MVESSNNKSGKGTKQTDGKTILKPSKPAKQDDARTVVKPSLHAQNKPIKGAAGESPEGGKTVFKKTAKQGARPAANAAKAGEGGKTVLKSSLKPQVQPQTSAGDGKTVLKPSIKTGAKQSPQQAKPVQSKPEEADAAQDIIDQHEVALTRIGKSMRGSDSSTGFKKAKQAADRALAEDKIILNKRFVLEETLGAGGMGTVYRAKDLRKVEANDLNPHIAVKVLNEDFKDHPNAFVTLQREASRSHTLSHPNIVTVHDFDRDGDVIFMTMELLQGQGLEVYLRQNRGTTIAKAEAFKIIQEFCLALSFAHKKDIIHSDLKPGNIFLTDDGAKVLDFGIARVANETAHEDFDAGELGALTPSYASLEMIQEAAPDPRDDIYAAAIIAYELLAGEHPYDRKPADKALAEKLQPARVKGLSNREWSALESALKLKRDERTKSIDDFLHGLVHKQKFPLFKAVSAVLVVAVSAMLYYFNFIVPNELNQRIEQAYAKGEGCFTDSNYTCAIDSSNAVLEMDPEHTAATALLEKAKQAYLAQQVESLVDAGRACLAQQKDAACAKAKAAELAGLAPDNEQLKQLGLAIARFEKQQALLAALGRAQKCADVGDESCALEAIDEVLAFDASHSDALALRDSIFDAQQQREASAKETNRLYKKAMDKANRCFKQQSYDCAIASARSALKYKPNDASAESLKQKAAYAEQSRQENLQKAQRQMQKAEQCFERKNYTCAIANSESALEFVPDFAPAKSLRAKAKSELEALKKSFSIE